MFRFFASRLLQSALALLIIITATFFMLRFVPGGPFTAEKAVTPEILRNLEAHYGLDQPLWKQYADYLGSLLRGDFGPSFKYPNRTVNEILGDKLPVSLELGSLSLALALLMGWAFMNTRWGLVVRMVGDSSDAARALGTSVNGVRIAATTAGGFIAGLGGASLSLYYPGSWNEGLSSGQGLIAVALVIFARWSPVRCLGAALLFGGAGALGPALQSVGVSGYYHLFNAVPYVLTLAILVWTCSPKRSLKGAPLELGVSR